jgi:exosortase
MSSEARQYGWIAALGLLMAAFAWSNLPAVMDLHQRWSHDPQYSHGYLVPLFALYLLWRRWSLLPSTLRPAWWGIAILLAGALMRLTGTLYYFPWLTSLALLPTLAGLIILVGGWQALTWSRPALAFLVFMIPMPYGLERALGGPLQQIATAASAYLLETCGLPVLVRGNVICLQHIEIGVLEACNGLSMLLAFVALCTAVAMVVRRRWVEKSIVVASAAPIALAVNVLRITATGVLYETAGKRWGDLVFHDLAGWLMMTLALVLVAFELWLMGRLMNDASLAERSRTFPLAPAAAMETPALQGAARAPGFPASHAVLRG